MKAQLEWARLARVCRQMSQGLVRTLRYRGNLTGWSLDASAPLKELVDVRRPCLFS